jgi:hypothetical protein
LALAFLVLALIVEISLSRVETSDSNETISFSNFIDKIILAPVLFANSIQGTMFEA